MRPLTDLSHPNIIASITPQDTGLDSALLALVRLLARQAAKDPLIHPQTTAGGPQDGSNDQDEE